MKEIRPVRNQPVNVTYGAIFISGPWYIYIYIYIYQNR